MRAFGKYTMPIISRLTLIFAKPTLSEGADASDKIKRKIMDNMDKRTAAGSNKDRINNLRAFFREYLKFVSKLKPTLGIYDEIIASEFAEIEQTDGFKDAFAKRGKTDYRKWAEFLNLIKGFARLNGRSELDFETDVGMAISIFGESLKTFTDNFTPTALQGGLDYEMVDLHKKIMRTFNNGSGKQASGTMKEITKFANSLKRVKQWADLQKVTLPDKSKLVSVIGNTVIVKGNWSGE